MEWRPIETYDKLKKKPKFAVFYVKEFVHPIRSENNLLATVVTSRVFGNREITHWMPLPEPPK